MEHFFLFGPILFLYYEESLVSSILNSKLFRFDCVRPNVQIGNLTMKIKRLVAVFVQESLRKDAHTLIK